MPILMAMVSTGVHFQPLIISFCFAATKVSAKFLSSSVSVLVSGNPSFLMAWFTEAMAQ